MDLLTLEQYDEDTINSIINNNLEESINIEFKSSGALSKQDSVKKEISKDISAFANSDGGIIIYGLDEESHVASKVSFIDGNTYTKEWIENIILSTIQPRIDNLKIIPVRFNEEISKSLYVLKIPKSNNSPHMNGDKKYYRRFNFQSVPMEEYEVKNLYNKLDSYVLELEKITTKYSLKEDKVLFDIQVLMINVGQGICSEYKVAIDFENVVKLGLTWSNPNDIVVTHKDKRNFKVSSNKVVSIFPNEILNILNFTIEIDKDYFKQFISEANILLLIYEKSGITEMELNPNEMFKTEIIT